ncbi:hypothetical protein [Providencia rettgeri]|uniref:hypothetical protein n=1 Tax=Providencia rettgeri TaxID=587 RepID=UPI0020689492|nr:hypothetical protein [Providencia rettgeri]UPS61502.1 hypothetical protein M0M83_12765 [Providencia rettgeri]
MKIIKLAAYCWLGGYCLYIPTSQSEMITIGKGTGVVWEGMPFSERISSSITTPNITEGHGLVGINATQYICMPNTRLTSIAGIDALPITAGVGLVPRATASGLYQVQAEHNNELFTATIGLPTTEGTFKGVHSTANSITPWCLSPRTGNVSNFYRDPGNVSYNITGTWVIVADGNQQNAEIIIPALFAGHYQPNSLFKQIFPSYITLRVSTLECTVDTVTAINFGSVSSNTQQNSELATVTAPLNITCGQPTDQIDANINVQFRAISGLYNNTPTQLSLDQGGGYITGEINNVTGSGDCGLTSGITFDNQQIKLGNITTADSTKVLNNNVTWRLCSGGSNLPVGDVTASTEMLVTFN